MNDDVYNKLEQFFQQYPRITYKKKELLIRAGENPSGIFYLRKGIVREYIISKKGDELVINMYKPVSFFPMVWAVNGTKNRFFYETISPAEARLAPKKDVLRFLRENPDVMYDLLSRVYRGIEGLYTRIAYLMSGSANARLVTELLIYAKRFGEEGKSGIVVNVSEKDLASYAGMTRETVSREIKVLKEKQIADFIDNKLVITDMAKLENELDGDL